MTIHQAIYQSAELYDLAFSYRDFERECGFLKGLFTQRRGRPPRSFLELAAGPARHALELSRQGLNTTALDLVPEMATHALRLAEQRGLPLAYVTADMTAFTLPQPVELAACLLISATYLTTDAAVVSHLECVREALTSDGIYVLELPLHPADMVAPAVQYQPKREWHISADAGELDVQWEEEARDPADATHCGHARLVFHPKNGSADVVLEERARQREYRAQEVACLAAQAGLRVSAMYGDWNTEVALDSPDAWRLLVVLEKSASRNLPGTSQVGS